VAQLSDYLLITAVVIYSLAMVVYAGDFAYGQSGNAARAKTPVPRKAPQLAGVAAQGSAGSAEIDTAAAGGAEPLDAAAAGGAEPPEPPTAKPGPVTAETGAATPDDKLSPLLLGAVGLTLLGVAIHLAGVVTRGIAAHRAPWGDMYEFVTALSCVTVVFFVALMFRYRVWRLGLFVTGAVVVVLGLAETIIYTPVGPLVPALNSYWLGIHVAAMTIATGVFFVSAVLGGVYIFAERWARQVAAGRARADHGIMRRLPGPEALDRLAYRTVVFGFPVWTFGIIAGAIWADQAWGRYWGWDPVETWAFITWVVYACFLHARATAGWRGKRAAYIQIVGFGCLIFNVLVVQTYVTGLHSYAGLG
jgi:cytochrome c-type biogenesis protein CcsB